MTDTLGRTTRDRLAPTPGRPAARRVTALAGAAALGAAGLAYVGLRDPHDPGVAMPVCPVHWATGLECPGCGGLRMTHDLLHGDVAAAFADNAVLLLLAPVLLVLLARAAYRWAWRVPAPAARTWEVSGPLGYAIAAVAFGWMLVRNLAGW